MTRSARGAGFTLIEIMVTVLIVGILAVVAIPAFMRYMRRARTVEATVNVKRIYDSSVAYYESEHADASQKIVPRQFPAAQADTPAVNACCGQPGDKCDPAAALASWRTPTWQALNFAMSDPFYYWYRYDSGGVDRASNFSAWAFGNLDCDSRYSTFMRGAKIDSVNNVTGGAGLYAQYETE